MMQEYVQKIMLLLKNPKKFYQSVEKEKNIMPILLFFVVAYVISTVLGVLFSLPYILSSSQNIILLMGMLFGMFASIFAAFITPFISSGLVHLGVIIFGGKEGFFNTFKPVTYSGIIAMLYGILSSLIYSIFFTFLGVDYLTYQESFPFSFFKGPYIIMNVIGLTVSLIGVIHVLYLEIIGLEKFQKISRLKAFFSIIIVLALVMIPIFILALIGAFAYFGVLSLG